MGVTYKLKKEVVDFIIESKQQDPSLSCRYLVSLVTEKFRVHVSKSSVSDILKEAALNSPIGRRVQENKTPKFAIPPTTKQKLFENINDADSFEKKSVAKKSSRRDDSLDQNLVDKLLAPPKAISSKSKLQDKKEVVKSKGLPLIPDPTDNGFEPQREESIQKAESPAQSDEYQALEEALEAKAFSDQIHRLRAERHIPSGPVWQGLGCIFLKAAQWELSEHSTLGQILRKYMKGPLVPQIEDAIDTAWLLDFMGGDLDNPSPGLDQHAIWNLMGLDPQPPVWPMRWLASVECHPAMSIEYIYEKRQLKYTVEAFQVFLSDGSSWIMDAHMASFWTKDVPSVFRRTLPQAMRLISKELISNNNPFVLCQSPLLGEGSDIGKLMEAFRGSSKLFINKISALNDASETIAEFRTLPIKARNWIWGVWYWQSDYDHLRRFIRTDEKKWVYLKEIDKVICFWESDHVDERTRILLGEVKAVAISIDDKPRAILLTNQVNIPSEKIVAQFVMRWPQLDKGSVGGQLRTQAFWGGTPPKNTENMDADKECRFTELREFFNDWGQFVLSCAQTQYGSMALQALSSMQMIEGMNRLSGYVRKTKEYLHVRLITSTGLWYEQDLVHAAQQVNERVIYTPNGRRLLIEVSP